MMQDWAGYRRKFGEALGVAIAVNAGAALVYAARTHGAYDASANPDT